MQNRTSFKQLEQQYRKEATPIYMSYTQEAYEKQVPLVKFLSKKLSEKFLKNDLKYLELICQATDGFTRVPTKAALEKIKTVETFQREEIEAYSKEELSILQKASEKINHLPALSDFKVFFDKERDVVREFNEIPSPFSMESEDSSDELDVDSVDPQPKLVSNPSFTSTSSEGSSNYYSSVSDGKTSGTSRLTAQMNSPAPLLQRPNTAPTAARKGKDMLERSNTAPTSDIHRHPAPAVAPKMDYIKLFLKKFSRKEKTKQSDATSSSWAMKRK